MFMHRVRPRRITLCLIALLWVLGAVLPTVSHAWLAQAERNNVVNELPGNTICSVGDSASQGSPAGTEHGLMDLCGVCLPHAGAIGIPPMAAFAGVPVTNLRPEALPSLCLHAPRPLFAWAAPALRGPPRA